MKRIRILILSALLALFASETLTAQFGYGNPYGRYGRQRSIVPQAGGQPTQKQDPLTAEEIVDGQMPSITEALSLNPFEEAVVRTTLVKSVQQSIELQILELDQDKMKEAVEKIRERQEEELKAGLPEDKYNAFLELQENRFKTKKKKKKKKKKSKE